MPRMTRRTALKALAGLGSLAAGAWVALRYGLPDRMAGRQRPARHDSVTEPPALTAGELTTMTALAEVLIPADTTPGADPAWARGYLAERTRRPHYRREYRAAARLLDELARAAHGGATTFSALTASDRDALLRRHFAERSLFQAALLSAGVAPEGLTRRERCRQHVMRDLLVAFYRSPAGWAVVGYTNYPGSPGDPRDYTRPGPTVTSAAP